MAQIHKEAIMATKSNVAKSEKVNKSRTKNPSTKRTRKAEAIQQSETEVNIASATEATLEQEEPQINTTVTEEIIEKEIDSLKQLFPDLRSNYDKKTIERYSEADPNKLPPVTLARCENDADVDEKVIDGWFIILALKKAGQTTARCRYKKVESNNEAYVKALEKNCQHGKHLTREEKTKHAKKLSNEGKTQIEIGKILGVHQTNVGRMLDDAIQDKRTHKEKLLFRNLKRSIKLMNELDELAEIEGLTEIKEAIQDHIVAIKELLAEDKEDDTSETETDEEASDTETEESEEDSEESSAEEANEDA
jgi:predicted transcriptional regulator